MPINCVFHLQDGITLIMHDKQPNITHLNNVEREECHHVFSAGLNTMTCPNIQTAHFSPSQCTLNANAALTLSCQAVFFLLEDCSRRHIDRWPHSLLLEEERAVFKWEFKTVRVFFKSNRTQTHHYFQSSYNQPHSLFLYLSSCLLCDPKDLSSLSFTVELKRVTLRSEISFFFYSTALSSGE